MEKPFPAYQGDEPYIFVSWSHDDAELVYPELQRLRDAGFNVWYDDGIRPGSSWREEVALALTECKLFIYFLTENAVGSENCHQELNFALSRERKILAVHLTPTKLTAGVELSLSNKQAIMKHELTDAQFETKFIEAVRSLMPSIKPIALPGVDESLPEIERKSIAILPFYNRSSDAENEYLCDGIAEELITGLAKLKDLTVASQLQSFAYKGQTQDISLIGQKLKSANVLTGSVQKSGQRVRITATLTETRSGRVLWSDRYDGTLDDVFELQEEVANKVVEALKVELAGEEKTAGAIIDAGTESQAAYQHFLLGKYEFGKSTRAGRIAAHQHFTRAIEADAAFGRAAFFDMVNWCIRRDAGHVTQQAMYAPARGRLEQVLASDFVPPAPRRHYERWLSNEAPDYKRWAAEALEALQSSDPEWHGFEYSLLGSILAASGLLNGAADFMAHYLTRNPADADNGPMHHNYANTLFALGKFEKAIEQFSAIYARDPSQVLSLGTRAMLYSRTGQYAKASEDLAVLAETFPRNFAQFYDLYWRREMDAATAYFDWMESQKNLAPVFKIWGCFLLGHIERGFDHLEAVGFNPAALRILVLYPLTPSMIRDVTGHPRYPKLLESWGLDEAWKMELMARVNELEHLTGIHVSLDEDY